MVAGRRALAVVVTVVALGAGACSNGKHSAAASPTTTTTTPPTTSTTVGVDQIPPVITVEYAQRVMDALDRLEGDITRLLVAKRVPTLEFKQMLTALYDEPAFAKAETSYGRDAADDMHDYLDKPGNPVTHVTRVVDFSTSCVVL